MNFSQRMGLAPAKKVAQIDDIDVDLRNALWNVLTVNLFSTYRHSDRYGPNRLKGSNFDAFSRVLYADFYKIPLDTLPNHWSSFNTLVRDNYFKISWHRVYSFVEFVVAIDHGGNGQLLAEACNVALDRENSAYRFVSGRLTPITSSEEIGEIENAISGSEKFSGVRTHLQTSLGFLVDRQSPDYRNSIKESISAVESLAKKLVGDEKATLGQALKVLEKKHNLHPSLKTAFSALYGYTNDADGIRHSLMENETQLTKADARFMLICCSAFINFAIDSIED